MIGANHDRHIARELLKLDIDRRFRLVSLEEYCQVVIVSVVSVDYIFQECIGIARPLRLIEIYAVHSRRQTLAAEASLFSQQRTEAAHRYIRRENILKVVVEMHCPIGDPSGAWIQWIDGFLPYVLTNRSSVLIRPCYIAVFMTFKP